MISVRYGMLFPLATIVACAGGTTMRVAQDDGNGEAPVALAPTPEEGPSGTADTLATPAAPATAIDTAASPDGKAQGYAPYGQGGALEVKRIGQWTRTGVAEARRLVIRDANAWAALWSELGVGERPAIDFSHNLVVAVSAGQRPSGGYEIAVESVHQANGELAVQVVETNPGPNCMTTSSLTQPVDVVAIPTVTARSWSFIERKDVRGCH
jgi:hypothetical protein